MGFKLLNKTAADKMGEFLSAMRKNKHRKGSGKNLRNLIAQQELGRYGVLACYCCGQTVSKSMATIEHIIPQSLGGSTVMDNLALSHEVCNQQRGNTPTLRHAIVQ